MKGMFISVFLYKYEMVFEKPTEFTTVFIDEIIIGKKVGIKRN